MRTYLDCIPCLVKQSLKTGRQTDASDEILKEILDEAGDLIKNIPLENTPAETAALIYKIVREKTQVNDPYKETKLSNIKEAKSLVPKIKEIINNSDDRLLTAIRVSIAGNVIDLGVEKDFNIFEDLKKILAQPFGISDYEHFKKRLKQAQTVLFIGDNAGESVFDKILIEELNKKVFYAVRDIPVINDVTYEDAVLSDLHEVSEIISSGVDSPGTIVAKANKNFQKLFENADIVISKGQGNYEGLSQQTREIFFLLKAKCPVIANDIKTKEDDIIIKVINPQI